MLLADLFWRFIIYSFLGWVLESILISIEERRLVNRGFLNGPVCPIYGCGALIMLLTLGSLQPWWYLVFFAGLLLATVLEYLTSWLMEKLFHARWWDYSDYFLNLNGRITIFHSIGWGILGLVLIYGLDPVVVKMLAAIPDRIRATLAVVFAAILLTDLAITVSGTIRLNHQLARLQEMIQMIRQKNSEFGENLQLRLSFLIKSFSEWRQLAKRIGLVQRRLLQAFPNLHSLRYPDALKKLRRRIKRQPHSLVWPSADVMLLHCQIPPVKRKKNSKTPHSNARDSKKD